MSGLRTGQGIGNAISGLFGGVAGAGATVRTVVNVRAGGRTPLSGALHSVVLLAIVAGLGRYASLIPLASLGGAHELHCIVIATVATASRGHSTAACDAVVLCAQACS